MRMGVSYKSSMVTRASGSEPQTAGTPSLAPPLAAAAVPGRQGSGTETELRDTFHLLLIDDDHESAEMYRMRLEANGYAVEWAQNGRLGLDRARAWQPELILLDVRMPDMDGLEVLRALREDPKTSNVPVVMLTNYGDDSMRREGERLGILEWQLKIDTTPATISSWIERWAFGLAEEGGR